MGRKSKGDTSRKVEARDGNTKERVPSGDAYDLQVVSAYEPHRHLRLSCSLEQLKSQAKRLVLR